MKRILKKIRIKKVSGFIDFVREQGVVGLAVGFLLGGAMQKMIVSLVNDIINPAIGIIIGKTGDLNGIFFQVGSAKIMYGSFINNVISFLIIAVVVYLTVKIIGLERLDRKKEG